MKGGRRDRTARRAKTPLERARAQLVHGRRDIAPEDLEALGALLASALERAGAAEPEVLTVMNPVSRPQRLALAVLVSDAKLDSMYGQERAEIAIAADGVCYLVYRRRDGGDYAVEWSPATLIPATTMREMPEVLVAVMLGGGES